MAGNSNKDRTERNQVIDMIKGVAIILMVLGHCVTGGIHNFIYLFHMAIFFIISGYCYKHSYIYNWKSIFQLWKKRLKKLYIPFIICNVSYVLLNNFFIYVGFYVDNVQHADEVNHISSIWGMHSFLDLKKLIIELIKVVLFVGKTEMGNATWFLPALFAIILFYTIVDFLFCKHHLERKIVFGIVFLIIGNYLCNWAKKNNDNFMIYELVTYIVILLNAYILLAIGETLCQKKLLDILSPIPTGFISFISLLLLNKCGSIATGNEYTNPLFYVIVSVMGFLFLWGIAKSINDFFPFAIRYFLYIGHNTLYIMCLHFFFFKIVSFIQTKYYGKPYYFASAYPTLYLNTLWSFIYLLAGLVGPTAVVMIKNKLINKWIKLQQGKVSSEV